MKLGQAAEIRLGRQRAPQYEEGEYQVPYLRSANVVDGALDLSDVKLMNFTPQEQRWFELRLGDVLVTEGSGSRETVGTSAVWMGEISGPVCFQNTLLRMRPREGFTEGRFLAWWMRHARHAGLVALVSTGANIQHLGAEGLTGLPIHVPSLEEQRRIADFLDDRVAIISELIRAKAAIRDEASAQVEIKWANLTQRLDGPRVPIRRFLASIADGPFGSSLTSAHYSDSGTRVIRLGNIGINEFKAEDEAYIPNSYAAKLSAHAACPGDVVMAGLGDERMPLGRCAVVPGDLGPAIVKADCYRLRFDPRIGSEFAAAFLSSPPVRGEAALLARGATRARMNTDLARQIAIAVCGIEDQGRYTSAVLELRTGLAEATSRIIRQIETICEYRQSLITAAVTGQLDVTTASRKIPEGL